MLTGTDNSTAASNVPVSAANWDTLAGRISMLISLSKSCSEFARICGVSEAAARKWRSGESEPALKYLLAITEALEVSLIWLATGEGEMYVQKPQGDPGTGSGGANLRDKATQSASVAGSDQAHSDDTEAVWEDFALVPVYDVQASAGHGSHVDAELQTGQLAFKKSWLREKGLKIGHLAIITAKGDSMEPTICDRGVLLVDTRVDKIIDDSIYIVQADHHLIVKRLQQAFDGSVSIISDNPRYKEQTLNPDQAKTLKIAGRVCWYGHEI